jgi:hypothetical protein
VVQEEGENQERQEEQENQERQEDQKNQESNVEFGFDVKVKAIDLLVCLYLMDKIMYNKINYILFNLILDDKNNL